MINFAKWLKENVDDIVIPNLELGLPRSRDDQPKLSDLMQFAADLAKAGIGIDTRMVPADDLKPSQKDFDLDKVRDMQQTTNPTLDAPLYISRDMFVVDGHHRWLAAANNNAPVLVNHIDSDFMALIEFLNGLQYPLNRDVE